MSAPKLLAIAIAKNEESLIRNWISHWSPWVDQVCVLDTGSQDNTLEKAQSAGAVVEKTLFHSFDLARNEAIERFASPGDWVVMTDVDERVDETTQRALRDTCARARHDIFLANTVAVNRDDSKTLWVPKAFLWKVSPDIRWVFKVHEKLIGSHSQAILENATVFHEVGLKSPMRRTEAEQKYALLLSKEPFYTDIEFRETMRSEWPILDYERREDPRLDHLFHGPLVSVVIPTYNRAALLDQAIASVQAQNWINTEIIVVGDGCPDLKEKAGATTINLNKNYGSGGAVPRNHGIALARGHYIAYLDDDNRWLEDHLSSLVVALQKKERRWGFSSMLVDYFGRPVPIRFSEPRRGGIDTSCVMHERSLIAEVGWWKDRAEAGYAHDWEFFSRFTQPYVATGKATVWYNLETSGQKKFIERIIEEQEHETSP